MNGTPGNWENDLHCKGYLLWSSEQPIRMYWCVMNRWSNVLMWASQILNSIELSDWLREYICLSRGPPCWLSWQRLLFHSSSHVVLPGGERADMHYNWCRLRWIQRSVSSVFWLKTNGWLHWASKLHLDGISSSCFQQFFFTYTRQCSIQLWPHSLDLPAHWILSLLHHPFVSCI